MFGKLPFIVVRARPPPARRRLLRGAGTCSTRRRHPPMCMAWLEPHPERDVEGIADAAKPEALCNLQDRRARADFCPSPTGTAAAPGRPRSCCAMGLVGLPKPQRSSVDG